MNSITVRQASNPPGGADFQPAPGVFPTLEQAQAGKLPARPHGQEACATAGKTLVLGMGNDILTDDAIGIHVAREVSQRVADMENVEVLVTMEMGLALLDFVVGYETLLLVDAIQTGRAAPGHIHEITPQQLEMLPDRTPHFLGVAETLLLGRQLGLVMPKRLRIFAIEVADPFTFGTQMTPALRRALPLAVERVLAAIRCASAEAVSQSLSSH